MGGLHSIAISAIKVVNIRMVVLVNSTFMKDGYLVYIVVYIVQNYLRDSAYSVNS